MTAAAGKPADEFVPHPVKEQLPGVDYCVNSNPSWGEAIVLGFQHYLVMLGTTVITSTIIASYMGGGNVEKAQLIQTSLFVSGINTLLQTTFGTRLPVVIGSSFRFIIPSLYVALAQRYYIFYPTPYQRFIRTMRAIQGALMVASVLPMLLGFLGIWRLVVRMLSPLSAVPLVALVGLGLYEQGLPLLAQCVEIGLPELILLILFSQYVHKMWSNKHPIFERYAVLISVGIVWAFAALLTVAGAYKNRPLNTQLSCRVDRSGLVGASSWISIPYPVQWGQPSLHAGEALVTLAAAFVALVESTGAFIAASRYGSATHVPASVLSRGIGWLGVGIFLDGLFGTGAGSTVSVENVGLLALTRVGSRRVIQISAVCMLFFAVLGKFGAIVASIPLPIVGALYCVLFALMSTASLGLLQYCNLNSFRTMFIIGFSLFMGLSVPRYFRDYVIISGHGPVHTRSSWFNNMVLVIFTSPATVAAIVALFLDLTLGRKHGSTRRDSGRHWWAKFKYFDRDPRSAEFYSLPGGLSKYFPSA
ncbi:nucleobase-ascorbate transporter 4 [Dorcoceras hygrometricum]|uniref:Nucleobase-ascorbate transporter 4 n=1 Tax=Dorcoceras hygrometricum TaxID=472368 RepID=A0A2Z7DAX5_9LAMI|nr:nucleobase-ascorbate transporter 4 [Dorcoceras hygrometricum]